MHDGRRQKERKKKKRRITTELAEEPQRKRRLGDKTRRSCGHGVQPFARLRVNNAGPVRGLGGAREIQGALVGGEGGGYAVVDFLDQGFAVVEGVGSGVDGIEEFHENFTGMDDEFAFFHNAVRAGAGDRNHRNTRLDGHDGSSLLELLEAAVGTARAFGVDQERLSVAQGLDGFVDAVDGGLAIETIDRNEMGEMEGLADDGPVEQRAFEENGDAAGDGTDNGGSIGGTGVIRGENAGAGRNALGAFHLDADTDAVDEEHHTFQAGPIERIDVFGEEGINEKRRADDQDVEADENGNEGGTEHGLIRFL